MAQYLVWLAPAFEHHITQVEAESEEAAKLEALKTVSPQRLWIVDRVSEVGSD
jgi:hypothetical protein